jgi:hypothetical protein
LIPRSSLDFSKCSRRGLNTVRRIFIGRPLALTAVCRAICSLADRSTGRSVKTCGQPMFAVPRKYSAWQMDKAIKRNSGERKKFVGVSFMFV